MNVGYVVSRFPKTTETFIAREAFGLSELGHNVSMISIIRETDQIVQTEAARFVPGLTAVGDAGPIELLVSQVRWLRRAPGRVIRMWIRTVVGNIGSPKFLVRAMTTAMGAPWTADRVERQGLDVLHAHWGTHSAMFAFQLSILTGLPYSVTLHAHDLYVDRSMLPDKLRAATTVVTISDHNRQMIASLYPDVTHKIEVVHCGVDVGSITPRTAAPDNNPPRAAVVAGLRDYKGHAYLIEAHKILEDRGFGLNLDIVGDGPVREELEAMVTGSPIEGRVTFHGARPVDEAIEIVGQADVFVMPSVVLPSGRKDGIPVALMEAMALRVPVVSTRVSGIPELVEHEVTGLLADERDPIGLADAVERLLTDRALSDRLADEGRRRVVEQFDLGQTIEAMDRIIRHEGVRPSALNR
ncbi:MAG: glycosyltransferase [Acidimicrobiia bacterium]|nr:glycosyltransferase [Acidimicrobiia bacterium]